MPVIYHEKSKTFHLYNDSISYIFKILENGQCGQLYYGKRIRDKENYDELYELRKRPMSPMYFEENETFSLEQIKQEYPVSNQGDLRDCALTLVNAWNSTVSHFSYSMHMVYEGKKPISGLPSTYVESEKEATTLEVHLEDAVTKTELILFYTLYESLPVITRHVKIVYHGEKTIRLERVMSMSLDLPDSDYEMLELTGAWSRERYVKWRSLQQGIQSVYSLRGHSSHQYNPFLALKRRNADEQQGEVLGISFIYSGSFLAQVEVDTYDVTRIMMGIHPEQFSWTLHPKEAFETPEAVLVYSDMGLNGMSQTFHTLYQSRLARGVWRDRDRPILINNWEATYMDFTEEKILDIVAEARKLGMELFVLDDGWYGRRNDDKDGLGDWYVNTKKLPSGITGLSRKVHEAGMLFGLWIEPEMVNKKSDLYRQHPDWVMQDPRYHGSHGRNQYVLDFTRQEVVDEIFHQIDAILSSAQIDYIKWDMNRTMSEVYSNSSIEQGRVVHSYILGVYQLYERLLSKYPSILFESCASGGGRFDPGMLYYAPQCWTSDDTDAAERMKIQYGTSYVYPVSSMGAHVSASPNLQVLRKTPLNTRFNVACFGAFGYELDLSSLSREEKEEIAREVAFVKKYRHLLQYGRFYRLKSPFEGMEMAWMVVSEDRKEAIVGYYRLLQKVNGKFDRLVLRGLREDFLYHISDLQESLYGDELMQAGLVVSDSSCGENQEKYTGRNSDFQSRLYILKVKE